MMPPNFLGRVNLGLGQFILGRAKKYLRTPDLADDAFNSRMCFYEHAPIINTFALTDCASEV